MALDLSVTNLLGLATGGAILLVGLFVLLARPASLAHRAFFLFAVVDGMSNLLFTLRDVYAEDAELRAYFMATYYWFYVAFIAGLIAFGLLYPRPLGGAARARLVFAATMGAAIVVLALYAVRHDWFWTLAPNGAFRRAPGGQLISLFFPLGIALVTAKLATDALRAPTLAVREQSAVMMGGMVIGYATVIWGLSVNSLQRADATLFGPSGLTRAISWTALVAGLGIVALGVALWRRRREMTPFQARFLAIAYISALVITSIGLVDTSTFTLVQILGLLAYPAILAYAIFRAEAFEINPQLRRATTLTLAGAGIAVLFILIENRIENVVGDLLVDTVFAAASTETTLSIVSAIVAAGLVVPILHTARRLATRILPLDAEHVRNLATYRLVLEGALEDGLLDARESRALESLRVSLHISERDHERLIADVRAAKLRATGFVPPADATASSAAADAPRDP